MFQLLFRKSLHYSLTSICVLRGLIAGMISLNILLSFFVCERYFASDSLRFGQLLFEITAGFGLFLQSSLLKVKKYGKYFSFLISGLSKVYLPKQFFIRSKLWNFSIVWEHEKNLNLNLRQEFSTDYFIISEKKKIYLYMCILYDFIY